MGWGLSLADTGMAGIVMGCIGTGVGWLGMCWACWAGAGTGAATAGGVTMFRGEEKNMGGS